MVAMLLLVTCGPTGTPRAPAPTGVAPTAVSTVAPSATLTRPQATTPAEPATPAATATTPAEPATPAATATTPAKPATPPPLAVGPLIGLELWTDDIPTLCPQMPELGVRATTIRLAWDAYEPKKGSFSWAELDEGVAKLHSCGVTISAHIRSTSSWGTQPQPGVPVPQTSMPPLNMQDYHDFVYALATRYRGLDIRWAIENEGAFSFYWGGTVDEYAELLRTGYGAIKAADPGAIVENDGITSAGLFFLIAADLFENGQQQQAVDYLNQGWANYPPGGAAAPVAVQISTPRQFQSLMNADFGRRHLEWLDMLLRNHPYYDILQLHWHSPQVEVLPGVLEWFHQKMQVAGFDKPIDLWELGYGWADPKTYDETKQAQAVPKLLGAAVGEGVPYLIYSRWSGRPLVAGTMTNALMGPDGPKPGVAAFQASALQLGGVTGAERLDLPAGLWGYRYYSSGGEFYMVWRTQPGSGTVALAVDAASVTVTNLVTQATGQADPKAILLGDDPILVEEP